MQQPPVPGSLSRAGDRPRLLAVIAEARDRGFVGPGDVGAQLDRSLALLPPVQEAVAQTSTSRPNALDMGSGGGLPGLILAWCLPAWRWTLLDGSVRRTEWLREAVDRLDLGGSVSVVTARAEAAGHDALRSTQDLVVARGFGPPPATAECAAPLLTMGGALLVTDPPGGAPGRWSTAGLALLGLRPEVPGSSPIATYLARATEPCPDRYARRTGIPVKRPLW